MSLICRMVAFPKKSSVTKGLMQFSRQLTDPIEINKLGAHRNGAVAPV